jgi:hypothetical protein
VELEVSSIDIYDNPPLSEYQMFVRSLGGKSSIQASTQTNEDSGFQETQTEEPDVDDKFNQFPDDMGYSYHHLSRDSVSVDQIGVMKFLSTSSQVIFLTIIRL